MKARICDFCKKNKTEIKAILRLTGLGQKKLGDICEPCAAALMKKILEVVNETEKKGDVLRQEGLRGTHVEDDAEAPDELGEST